MRTSLVVFLLVAGGCAPLSSSPSSLEESVAAESLPTITFGADWSVTQSGPLVAGGHAVIRYDLARLPKCRARSHGGDAWAVQVSWQGDGGAVQNGAVFQRQGMDIVPADLTIQVPFARDLAVWFLNTDVAGCSAYDSNFGQNFHFAIEPAAASAVIHFQRDWSQSIDGALAAGGNVIVDYDLDRLTGCRAGYNGYQTWEVLARWRVDGSEVQSGPLTQVSGMYGRIAAPLTIALPSGGHALELWFENNDRSGCRAFDSAFGSNYTFAI